MTESLKSSASRADPEPPQEVAFVPGYVHRLGTHCESGSLRNLLCFAGLEVSEPMVFGVGTGPAFYYVFWAKGLGVMPLVGLRNMPGGIVKNVKRRTGLDIVMTQYPSAGRAMAALDRKLDQGIPCTASVDMFRMKYLPNFMRIHAPFHFIVLAGRRGDTYAVSDPYYEETGFLSREDLMAGWETHSPVARDNLVCHVRSVSASFDWRLAVKKAIHSTCWSMLPPPGLRRLLWFVGAQGMRTYARALLQWPDRHAGVQLREGILFNALSFEDQGTGGGAFRLMYGAFLQEVAELFGVSEMNDLAARLITHGRAWRAWSRKIIVTARAIPLDDDAYPDWHAENGKTLREGLRDASEEFLKFADFEEQFFTDLRAAAGRLP